MMFACVTPLLITGTVAERMRWQPYLLFMLGFEVRACTSFLSTRHFVSAYAHAVFGLRMRRGAASGGDCRAWNLICPCISPAPLPHLRRDWG